LAQALKPRSVSTQAMQHRPRCACGCVPAVPSMFEMAQLRAARRQAKEERSKRSEDLRHLRELMATQEGLSRQLEAERAVRSAFLSLHEPGASEAERTVEVTLPSPNGRVEFVVAQDAGLAQGGLLWESGLALARHLAKAAGTSGAPPTAAGAPRPLRVLELGCGAAALPSQVVAAVLGAQVLATDSERVAELAARNVERNAAALRLDAEAAVRTAPYAWSEAEPPPGSPYDLVLGADLLYDEGAQAGLASAVAAAARPGGGQVLLSYEVRCSSVEARFFRRLRDLGAAPVRLLEELRPEVAGRSCTVRVVCVRFGLDADEAPPAGGDADEVPPAEAPPPSSGEGLYL